MYGSVNDLPIAVEIPQGTIRSIEWGNMNIEVGAFAVEADPGPLFAGLPDDRCQCPHWGYVIKGVLRFRYADREELYRAGDAYYAPPGHLPMITAGTQYIEFSPLHDYHATMEVIGRNMAAMMAGE